MTHASQRGITCMAPNRGTEQTFVLLEEWVDHSNRPSRDEALATIAIRYVRSHGPVPRSDLAGWTGLTAADTASAVGAAGDALTTVEVDGLAMLVASEALADAPPTPFVAEMEFLRNAKPIGSATFSLEVDGTDPTAEEQSGDGGEESGDRVDGSLGGKSRTDFQADKKQCDRRAQRIPRQNAGHPRADMFGHNRQPDDDRYGDQYFQQYEKRRHRLPFSPAS